MKKGVLIGLTTLLLASSLTAGESKNSEQITITPTSGKIYQLSYEEGMKQIATINSAEKNELEDCWLFDDSGWHDIGRHHSSPVQGSVEVDWELYEKIIIETPSDTLYLVHNHPPKTEAHLRLVEANRHLCLFQNLPSEYGPPSPGDLMSGEKAHEIAVRSNKKVIFQAVASEGIWGYQIKSDGRTYSLSFEPHQGGSK